MDLAEAHDLLTQLDGWAIEGAQGHSRLVKTFKAKGFAGAMDIANRITPIAEAENHHPDLLIRWGSVTVHLWTHAAGGLPENDFVMAAKLDRADLSNSLQLL